MDTIKLDLIIRFLERLHKKGEQTIRIDSLIDLLTEIRDCNF